MQTWELPDGKVAILAEDWQALQANLAQAQRERDEAKAKVQRARMDEATAYQWAWYCLYPIRGDGAEVHRVQQAADRIASAILAAATGPIASRKGGTLPPESEGG